ncbi:MAG: hypothetical protein ACU0FH_07380 [Heliomarina sp.]|uniref:hypothetical protein n=1 Tax=Heliomarina sp. TaxID=2917556 RepID=UPI004058DEC5
MNGITPKLSTALGAAALAISASLFFPDTVNAQTPGDIKAANELRVCLWEEGGIRSAPRAGELQLGIDRFQNEKIWSVNQVETGVYRITRNQPSGLTAEIRLPDENGNATCLVYGPAMSAGQAAGAADKFVEFGTLKGFPEGGGFVAAEPLQNMSRRYVAQGLPFSLELVAYEAPGFGQIVGMTFAGLDKVEDARQLTVGQAPASRETLRAYSAWALQTCAQNIADSDWLRSAFDNSGLEYGWPASNGHVYFLPDNSLSVKFNSYTCEIDTHYMGVAEARQLVRETLNRAYPGQFSDMQSSDGSGCQSFISHANPNMPIIVNVENLDNDARRTCVEDGSSRIYFEIPG